jgi:hypothetical protein
MSGYGYLSLVLIGKKLHRLILVLFIGICEKATNEIIKIWN